MPPFIDGIMEPTKLYYSDGDGNYVKLSDVQDAVLELEMKNDPDIVMPSFTETGELCFTLNMTPASSRRWRRTFHAFSNHIRRTIRTMKRQKEKQRRDRLKGKV